MRKLELLSGPLCGLVFAFGPLALSAGAQTPAPSEWTWMGGSSTGSQPGVYGPLGTAAAGNIPGAREAATSCSDKNGNHWLFGGYGNGIAGGRGGDLNDLWEFNPSTNEWTWISGSSTGDQSGVYGTLATPAAGNVPGGRLDAVSWTDSSGNLWLFGGIGFDSSNNEGFLNDLWEFNPSTNEWAWMGGGSTVGSYESGQPGVYGKLGTAAPGNTPGGRQNAASWVDSSGNLWLFGGNGFDGNGSSGELNDLWEFNPSTNEWAWMGGSSTIGSNGGQSGVYGELGTPAAGNIPGGRLGAVSWVDEEGYAWLFGGLGVDSAGTNAHLNDLWRFDPNTNEWAWMAGSSAVTASGPDDQPGQPGVYGTLGIPAVGNHPGGREYATNWTDGRGNFWLFGGEGLDENDDYRYLNDLWEFDPSTNEWTWMGGSSTGIQSGVYGTLGSPAAGNIPGSRLKTASWVDSSGYFWLFGGDGIDANGNFSSLNDVWEFSLTAAANPTFSVPSGTYTSTQTVTINDATAGATIYYTTDGTTPTANSTVYSGAISVSSTETVQAIAYAAHYESSAVVSATYTITLPPGFMVSGTAVTVVPGATTGNTATITLTPSGGFTGAISLTCSISPTAASDPATCSIPASVAISGSAAQTTTLTVNTTAATSAFNPARKLFWPPAGGAALACILLLGIPKRRRRWQTILGVFLPLLSITCGVLACGGGSNAVGGGGGGGNSGTTPGNYTITVTGISGAITETGTVSLTVQ